MTALAVFRRMDCRRRPKGLSTRQSLWPSLGSVEVRGSFRVGSMVCSWRSKSRQLNHQVLDSEDSLKRKRRRWSGSIVKAER